MRISDWSSDVCSSDLRINDAPAEFVKDRAGAVAAMLLEGARRQSEMHGSIGGADKAGRDRGNGCIHGQAPGGLGSTGAVPPTEAGNGASGTRAGSDRLGGSLLVTQIGKASCRERGGQYVESPG